MGVTLTETPLMFPIVLVTTLVSTKAFCDGPIPLLRFFEHGQDIGVRTALCSINRSIALPPAPTYLLLIAVTLAPIGDVPPAEFEAQYYEQAAVA